MPPVEPGEEYRIRIEEFGEEGDGIGYVEGFVVVVPGVGIGQWVTVEIDDVFDNFAVASVSEGEPDLLLEGPTRE